MADAHGEGKGEGHRHEVTINTLPDNILLEIFAFCVRDVAIDLSMREWQRLVHVCQRWRQVTYASPRYLDLLLFWSKRTPVRNLSRWPEFPIAIHYHFPYEDCSDLIALLKHPDRVRFVNLSLTGLQFGRVATAMQEPFPMLTELELDVVDILPSGFLGGSAPCLKYVLLRGIRLSKFPKFLLSSRDLVFLRFDTTSCISPEAMVSGLSVLTKLKTLHIGFLYPDFLAEQKTSHPGPPLRVVLPALTRFVFGGQSEYLEDFVAQLDAPHLDVIRMDFKFDQLDSLRLPQLSQFITRTEHLGFGHAQVTFGATKVKIKLIEFDRSNGDHQPSRPHFFSLCGSFGRSGTHVEHLTHVLNLLFAMFSNLNHLFIHASEDCSGWQDNIDGTKWLTFLRLFTTVETLHVSGKLASQVAYALEDVPEEMVTEVLPSLHQLLFEGFEEFGGYDVLVESTAHFVYLRQLYRHPVTIVDSGA